MELSIYINNLEHYIKYSVKNISLKKHIDQLMDWSFIYFYNF